MNPPPQSPLQIILEPCQSGLTYLFAKEAGASNPLGSSNLPGSAKIRSPQDDYIFAGRRSALRRRPSRSKATMNPPPQKFGIQVCLFNAILIACLHYKSFYKQSGFRSYLSDLLRSCSLLSSLVFWHEYSHLSVSLGSCSSSHTSLTGFSFSTSYLFIRCDIINSCRLLTIIKNYFYGKRRSLRGDSSPTKRRRKPSLCFYFYVYSHPWTKSHAGAMFLLWRCPCESHAFISWEFSCFYCW